MEMTFVMNESNICRGIGYPMESFKTVLVVSIEIGFYQI